MNLTFDDVDSYEIVRLLIALFFDITAKMSVFET